MAAAFRFRENDPARARTARRPHARALDAFRSPENVAALRRALEVRLPKGPLREHAARTAGREALAFAAHGVSSGSVGGDILLDDPLAQRGRGLGRPGGAALGPVAELARLNRAFVAQRLRFVRDNAALLAGGRDAPEPEPHHMRMFTADSLRPPGLESLNGRGPLWEHVDDQAAPRRDDFAAYPDDSPAVASCDRAWAPGDGRQTAEESIAAYWGEGAVESGTAAAAGAPGGGHFGSPGRVPQKDVDSRSAGCGTRGGASRAMRRRGIPRWQHTAGALDGLDRDVEASLGDGNREMGSHVRRWGGHAGARVERAFRAGNKPFEFRYPTYTH